jgi:hypothetical protein
VIAAMEIAIFFFIVFPRAQPRAQKSLDLSGFRGKMSRR